MVDENSHEAYLFALEERRRKILGVFALVLGIIGFFLILHYTGLVTWDDWMVEIERFRKTRFDYDELGRLFGLEF